MYMREIDVQKVCEEIRKHGSLTKAAVYLMPQYEFRTDAYHHFKYWLKHGRMPVDKYKELQRYLNEKV